MNSSWLASTLKHSEQLISPCSVPEPQVIMDATIDDTRTSPMPLETVTQLQGRDESDHGTTMVANDWVPSWVSNQGWGWGWGHIGYNEESLSLWYFIYNCFLTQHKWYKFIVILWSILNNSFLPAVSQSYKWSWMLPLMIPGPHPCHWKLSHSCRDTTNPTMAANYYKYQAK